MLLIFLCIGLAAGVLSGMFGIGGGILIVPALVLLGHFPTKTALGTSLGALLLPVGLLGAYAYWERGNVDVRASLIIAAGISLGVYVGAHLAEILPTPILQRMFAVFIVAMAVQLWIKAGAV
ncbi:MAG TPA: sulfite exporter TauE/SafE family protein [Gemmatimonadales bacterium]|jgi:uncharacterized membrane protein YfcA|nr:sulfite exporter TauE/SafE family protein [Gemmatimonadales bacterium]